MNGLSKDSVNWVEIGEDAGDQRIDNFLMRILKGVPKSHVYRILRSGEVRVNSRRAAAATRLRPGDRLRIPPIRVSAREEMPPPFFPAARALDVVYEDDSLLVVNKPAGTAVHGGSGISHGVIELLRAARPPGRFLELVHRLDRETSGLLLLARKRSALVDLHAQIREGRVDKRYLALVRGRWVGSARTIDQPLTRHLLEGGDRRVAVDPEGQPSRTVVKPVQVFEEFSLLEARLLTGRTHQIRVHLAHLGLPICGDDKYGDFTLNRTLGRRGLRRMFLHASRLQITHPVTGDRLSLASDLPKELAGFLEQLSAPRADAEDRAE